MVDRERVIGGVLREGLGELVRARGLWPAFNSAHEGWAVLLEEVDEFGEELGRGFEPGARGEAVQVLAMAVRFVLDVTDVDAGVLPADVGELVWRRPIMREEGLISGTRLRLGVAALWSAVKGPVGEDRVREMREAALDVGACALRWLVDVYEMPRRRSLDAALRDG